MPIFEYRALNNQGKELKNIINSENITLAKQKLKMGGLMLIEIREQKAEVAQKGQITFGGKIKVEDLALLTRQFATLIKAKIQIVESLSALTDQADNPKLKVILAEIRQKVNEGSSLARALADYPKVFDNVYVNMVEAGESSGTLDIVLLRLADFTESQVKLKNKIKGAMIYPIIMILFGSIMMGIIFAFVIPKITKIFISMKKELPLPTKICIWISSTIQNYWWAILLSVFLSYIAFKKYTSTEGGQSKWHSLLLKLPQVGTLVTMINVSRFCSTLATLLNSGVPILTSMKIVKNLISNVHIQNAVEDAKISIAEGGTLAIPLNKSHLFPSMVTHMIGLGEKSGELEPMLQIIAENYDDQVDSKLAGLTSVLEPVMMVAMGCAVAFIVFSVVVPLMNLNSLR
ncbi:MAG: type II secretion system protein GspF [Bdellovibrionales bacterium GWA2_49_15]|nr:MAG: type II secretion system protein GspF [Bdellovibrionales bacterium GWA2_49_15]HAZ12409.1 type II secretion system protein GspF [Bdellovibrionales bacterium]